MEQSNQNHSQEQEEESMKQNQRRGEISCYYGLRENPKKKTQKSFGLESPEDSSFSIKKILFRCKECGKGFRYEKCLSNHQLGIHSNRKRIYEESLMSLCNGFSIVTKKKRSRIIRYNKNRSCSFMSDQELEVAECLILLSKSNEKFVDGLRIDGEVMDSGFLRNEVKSMEEKVKSDEVLKDSLSFVGDECELEQWKLRKTGEFESGFLSNERTQIVSGEFHSGFSSKEQKLLNFDEIGSGFFSNTQKLRISGEFESGFTNNEQKLRNSGEFGSGLLSNAQKLRNSGEFDSGYLRNEQNLRKAGELESGFMSKKQEPFKSGEIEFGFSKSGEIESEFLSNDQNLTEKSSKAEDFHETEMIKHKCKLCDKRFSSYQALGGHQTFHRMSKSKKKWKNEHDDDDDDDGGDDGDGDGDDDDEEAVTVTVTVKKMKMKTHKCGICLRLFRSVHALGGHMKCHRERRGEIGKI